MKMLYDIKSKVNFNIDKEAEKFKLLTPNLSIQTGISPKVQSTVKVDLPFVILELNWFSCAEHYILSALCALSLRFFVVIAEKNHPSLYSVLC